MRLIDQPPGRLIASGRTAEVYAWRQGWVLKLFASSVPLAHIEQEWRNSRLVHGLGLPVPAVGKRLYHQGRRGIEFECIEGPSLQARLSSEPQILVGAARQLARLQRKLHEQPAPEALPGQSAQLSHQLATSTWLSPDQRQALLVLLAELPQGERLCHGDFHPGNLLLSDKGPVIIDWMNACRGDPIADVARSALLFRGHVAITPAGELRAAMEFFLDSFLDCHRQAGYLDEERFATWTTLLAAVRLGEGIAEQQTWLCQLVQQGLAGDSLG